MHIVEKIDLKETEDCGFSVRMQIQFRFSLSEPIRLPDKWAIKVGAIIYAFGGPLENITEIIATLNNQSLDFAPKIAISNESGKLENIGLRHGLLLPLIVERLDNVQCTLGMLLPIEIDTTNYQVEFKPETVEEDSKIPIKSWGQGRKAPNNRVSFDLAAKGLLSDPWPENERKAAQFYRRGRSAVNERYFVDAFVNYYFFFERLYGGGKFKTAEVARRFSEQPDFQTAVSRLNKAALLDVERRGAPLNGSLDQLCEWIVGRRGFFQHQSETDPNRWLHSTQEAYAPEAFLMAELAMSVYAIRNGDRIFSKEMDGKWMAAAEEARATIEVVVHILGDDPEGNPVRHSFGINGPGLRLTREMARDILVKSIQVADQRLIAIRQMTATIKGTHELVFSYTGPTETANRKTNNY